MTRAADHAFCSRGKYQVSKAHGLSLSSFQCVRSSLLVSSKISFLISGTRHEKLVSIDRFSFSFLILCDSVAILVYLADLRI